MKIIATNKKAYFDYFVISTFEAGIVLLGSEVKAIRQGNVSIKDAFISISKDKEAFVKNMYIKKFDFATNIEIDEKRERKLLLKSKEISKMLTKVKEKGFTLVPLKVYFSNKYVKLEVGLVQGKHTYDKKQTLKDRDLNLEMKREIRNFRK